MHSLDSPLSLYIHIPFCSVRCSYCAFNTYTDLEHLKPAYVDALCRELAYTAEGNPHALLHTLYFGGGTPSLLDPTQFAQIIRQVMRFFNLSADAEISLEANPDDLSQDYLEQLRQLGFNRISIGMQSANARILRMFERQHDLMAVADAVESARRAGFEDVNLDVIFASPDESLAEWQTTVETVLRFEPDHVSMYGLELKGGTKLRQQVDGGELPKPDDDAFADMYEYASEQMMRHGYAQYEISNWCRPGMESRHNLQYWRNLPYLGIGAGAHGYAGGYRYSTIAAPQRYIASLSNPEHDDAPFPLTPAIAKSTKVEIEDELYETMMMSLRLTREGIDLAQFEKRFGLNFLDTFRAEIEKLESLGLLNVSDERVHISHKGRLLSNAVIREFTEAITVPI